MTLKVGLLVADDIQAMASGKTFASGLYPDGLLIASPAVGSDLIEPSAERPLVMAQLSLLVYAKGLEPGPVEGTISFFAPTGEMLVPEPTPVKIVASAQGNANMTFQFTPFATPSLGVHRVVVEIVGEVHELTFEILKPK